MFVMLKALEYLDSFFHYRRPLELSGSPVLREPNMEFLEDGHIIFADV